VEALLGFSRHCQLEELRRESYAVNYCPEISKEKIPESSNTKCPLSLF